MTEEKNYKICENCKYFIEHYAIHKTFLSRLRLGHCTENKTQVKNKRTTIFCSDYSCEKWEEAEPIKEENLKTAVKRLRDSIEKLTYVFQIKL